MRGILTASLPQDVIHEIKSRAKSLGVSVSEFILQLFHLEKNIISEEELMDSITLARKEHKAGKTQKISSLAELV